MQTTLLFSLLAAIYGPEPNLTQLNHSHLQTIEQTIITLKETAERLKQNELKIATGDLTSNIYRAFSSPVVPPEVTEPFSHEVLLKNCFHPGLMDLYLDTGIEIQIPLEAYSRLSAFSHDPPERFARYLTPNDSTMVALAECLTAESLTVEEAALEILNFVRKTEYARDGERDNYSAEFNIDRPYFPKETLCRGKADCEDTSILASSLLWAAGIENVLVRFPEHEMIAIKGDFSGYHINLGGGPFYLTETTSGGESIGIIHEDYIKQHMKVEIPIIGQREKFPFDF